MAPSFHATHQSIATLEGALTPGPPKSSIDSFRLDVTAPNCGVPPKEIPFDCVLRLTAVQSEAYGLLRGFVTQPVCPYLQQGADSEEV